jgi:murein hydrolase activator
MNRQRIATSVALAALLVMSAAPAAAQSSEQRIRQQREELERIRRERAELENRRSRLQNSVHDLREEVVILDRQADATARAMRSLDAQLASIATSVDEATANLVRAQDEQVVKTAVLRRRVADIYKRGPLYTAQVLLQAESFGDLVARYKYLHLVARRDQALLARVEELRAHVEDQRRVLVRLRGDMEESLIQKQEEERRLRALRAERGKNLAATSAEAKRTEERLARIQRDEMRLGSIISSLEDARRRAEARPNAPAPVASTIRTSDLGKLSWPVDGEIIYRFGRVVSANNTATRWNGIGIRASEGTNVKAVSAGEVMVAEAMGTYGLTVIVQHGGGDYSVYGSLQRIDVRKGQKVTKGQVIGGVGTSDPELPPHLHFEIRPKGRATDPLTWLRNQ